jgi:hypothetical protein
VEVRSVGLKSQIADYSYFMEALREGTLKHSGDPGLTRHVLNATVRIMPLGDAVFARPGASRTVNASFRDRRQIDALVAAVRRRRTAEVLGRSVSLEPAFWTAPVR